MTLALILLPLVAAVAAGFAPLPRPVSEALALLAGLAELALAAIAVIRFDVGGGSQFVTDRLWIGNFVGTADVRLHVAMDGLSLFMVALTAVGVLAAMWSAILAHRERPRAYLGLLLLLESALLVLFTARDLVLFYVGWEIMMIALIVLMGVWGKAGRRFATLQFVIYSLIGSLLMLVAIATLGVQGGSFDLATLAGQHRDSAWLFLAFCAAFCIKAPMFPLHGWLPAAYRESTPEVTALLSGVVSKAGAYGLIRFALPLFPATAASWKWLFLGLGLTGLLYASLVAFRQPDARGVVAYSSLGQMNLIVIGIFVFNSNGYSGAVFQMVNHGVVSLAAFLLIGLVELRTGTDAFRSLGGLANRRPVLSTALLIAALFALAVPGSSVFVSEIFILIGAFQQQALLGAAAACAIVLAAMYMLRWYSALAHEGDGERVAEQTADLRPGELAVAVPLIAILLVMSAWPFGVMERIGQAPQQQVQFQGAQANQLGTPVSYP
ncbi:MAG: NADH-quinone oxidoreductase subunit [Gaiellales bacterium]|nr:NADH-quinone oxidoreductase subunit [Gaiellales bacterium]